MLKHNISESFASEYLVSGVTFAGDNYIFHNCPLDVCDYARESLSKPYIVHPCVVTLTREDEKQFEKIASQCSQDLMIDFFARDLICSMAMREVVRNMPGKASYTHVLDLGIKDLLGGEMYKVKNFHTLAPFPHEVVDMANEAGGIEMDFFLMNTENKHLQRAINNFITARTPFSVKIFTNNEMLPSYMDQSGNYIECPHDYTDINIHNFIEKKSRYAENVSEAK